ncbi:hypothetical protein IW145_003831 [Coemansia sp. RSA 521]|nr:hypothetical protein IW145_003831 [Coemansia sp. RSA 521]KAJ2648934.1 hypothetical protein IW137_001162 [Coemansia sp. RSA 1287]
MVMATTQQQPVQQIQQLQSTNPVEVYSALRTIKNAIIGSNAKKTLYYQLQIIPHVSSLLALDDTDVQIRVQATTIVSSLAHKGEDVAQQLVDGGVMEALIGQVMPGTDAALMEASERALNALLGYKATRMGAEEHTHTMVPYLLSIITEAKESPRMFEMRMHARVELAVLILEKLCVTEARQFTVANTGAMDLLAPLLQRGYPRLQVATLRAFAALSYENMEISRALATVAHDGRMFPQLVAELARHSDADVRLHACLCLANLSRMRALGDARAVLTVAVPALAKLLRGSDVPRLQVIEALGYLCHEDAEIQMAAKNAGAVSDLVAILAEIESQDGADFVDHARNVQETRAVFLALGTIVSAGEECRMRAVESHAMAHLVRALGHSDDGVKAAACLCTQYIVRSVPICRTHVPESGLLRPLLALVRSSATSVQEKATAALINLLPDFSPLRADALKEGVVDVLAQLVESEHVTIRRNALWGLRNLLVGTDDDTRRQIIEHVGIARLSTLAQTGDKAVREQAAGVLQNVTAENEVGAQAVFDALGAPQVVKLLQTLLASEDSAVTVHALYLANNIAVRERSLCELIVGDRELLQTIVDYARSPVSEAAIGALWCINSIASHRADGDSDSSEPRFLAQLEAQNVQSMLETLLGDPGLCLGVRDRVKSCLDYFSSPAI